jgi:hypothetical protein
MYTIDYARKRSSRGVFASKLRKKIRLYFEEWNIDSLIDTVSGDRNFSFSTKNEGYGRRISPETVEKYAKEGYDMGCWVKDNGDLILHTISWEEK